ncbi:hypothetical protein CL617_00560 [archaeon]|nr:hypothetical protein [archaeon]|tara:strand:- start:257 stop:475 length:219 start_codon:yes stop_codon:yes gene_type:complete
MVTKTEIRKDLAKIRYRITNIASDGRALNGLEEEHDKISKTLDAKTRVIEYKKLTTAKKAYFRRARRRMARY